jgi:1-deoxy-D-xylulose-5-phosphate synthase
MDLLARVDDPSDLQRLPLDDLPRLAEEVRALILKTISEHGGHLGAALGVVELTVALHYVFQSPTDKLIWDIGHQAHAHKILTGRRALFPTIKQQGGISGFTRRSESPHDVFGAGHASTSISAALGIREALRLKDDPGKVIAVIGDAGMTGGMAFEALNNAGALRRDLIVVLNDNAMGISPTVGALSEWLSRKLTGGVMTRWRRRVRTVLDAFDNVGQDAIRFIERAMETTKVLLTPGILFEGLGFEYVGPIDGHDIPVLVDTFRDVRHVGQPILVHVVTTKGKGYAPAELEAQRFHGVGPFDLDTGLDVAHAPQPPTYTAVFGQTLTELAAADPRVVAITAAMLEGTGLVTVANRFPSRVYDVGIAEQHAVTFAAGLACEGFRPVVAIYSSFLQRAFDQIVHDVCLQNLPVIFCMDRAGLVGEDGPTHHGVFDPAYLRMIPNMAVMAPRDENELRHMLATAIAGNGPVAIRYPRGAGVGVPLDGPPTPLDWGRAEVLLEEGDDLALIAAGPTAHAALDAARRLKVEDGLRCTVVNARFIKPLDVELLAALISHAKAVVTVEESSLSGGFGSAILELCEQRGLRPVLRRLGVPDRWIAQGTILDQRRTCEIDADGIIAACRALRAQQSVAAGAADH